MIHVPIAIGAVKWLSAEEGGRRSGVPTGDRMYAVSYLGDRQEIAFSVQVRRPMPVGENDTNWTSAELFVPMLDNFPAAVQRRIRSRKRFDLFDGARVVAKFKARSLVGPPGQTARVDKLPRRQAIDALRLRRNALAAPVAEYDRQLAQLTAKG